MLATLTELTEAPRKDTGRLYIDATIRPNRALSDRGLTLIMTALIAISFAAGVSFLMMGAWPVVGFFGLDIVLIWVALRYTARRLDRELETIAVSGRIIHVSRMDARGQTRHWSVSPAFAKVEVIESEDFPPQVSLVCGGARLPIGTALSPTERLSLAKALETAIQRARNERYPQQDIGPNP
jgi:uncharacterized membrane protein